MSRKYYRRRRYYNRGPAPIDILGEALVGLLVFGGKVVGKTISAGYRAIKNKDMSQANTTYDSTSKGNTLVAPLIEKSSVQENKQVDYSSKYNLRSSLLTPTEEKFLKVLETVVGNRYRIIPQMQLSRLMDVRDSNKRFTNYKDWNQINKKSVDFVLCDEKLKPCIVIELDDYTHKRPDRIKRDEFLNSVMQEIGLRIIRVPVANSYDEVSLATRIFPEI